MALLLLPFCTWFVHAADDLMRQIVQPAYEKWATMRVWESVGRVWKQVFEGGYKVGWDGGWVWVKDAPSIIVKVTRILLALVVALSVTMILYNGMTYIIQTWRWEEWKNLVKNLVYIVIWILLALFSVTIITLLQSVSKTLDLETQEDWKQEIDKVNIEWWDTLWRTWDGIFKWFKSH